MAAAKKNESGKTSGKSPDPYLRSFLRQAVAIIAAEKGMNDASHAKLQKIANQLSLSERVFESAMQQLKAPENTLGLSRYEQRFVERIATEFIKFKGDVLSIRNEKRLVDIASDKYQIPPVRAHQLIRKTADQHNVGVISHSDAQQLVQHLIEDSVGGLTTFSATESQRLATIGERWGVPAAQSRIQIDRLTSSNRTRYRVAAAKRYSFYGVCFLAIVGAILLLKQIDWARLASSEHGPVEVVAEESKQIVFPAWWTNEMVKIAASSTGPLQRQIAGIASQSGDVAAITDEERDAGYSALVDFATNRPSQGLVDEFIAGSYYHEPNQPNALSIGNILFSVLEKIQVDDSLAPSRIRRTNRATEILTKLAFADKRRDETAAGRRLHVQHLLEQIPDSPDFERSSQEYLAAMKHNLSSLIWSRALQVSLANPKSTAASLKELEKLSPGSSPEINELRMRICQQIIEADPVQWTNVRQSVEKSIDQSNQANLKSWIRIVIGESQPLNVRSSIATMLARRLEFGPSSNKAMIASLTDYYRRSSIENLDVQVECSRILKSKMQKLQQRLRVSGAASLPGKPNSIDENQLPELILKVGEANNQILAWLNGRASLDSIRSSISNAERIAAEKFSKPALPTPFQRRQFIESLSRLDDRRADQSAGSIRVLNRIRKLADRIANLEPESARTLASYLIMPKSQAEQLAVERALPDFARWPRLKLALLDRLEGSQLSKNELVELFKQLGVSSALEIPRDNQWNAKLRASILERCHEQLVAQIEKSPEFLMWSGFEKFYSNLVSERVSSLLPSTEPKASGWLASLAKATLQSSDWVQRHVDLIEREPIKMNRWSRANYLIAEMIRNQKFDAGANAKIDGMGGPSTVGKVLLKSELHLMRVLQAAFDSRCQWIGEGGS